MDSKVLIGKNVIHKSYGKGSVTEADANYIHVLFEDGKKNSVFQFPGGFYKFLSIEDESLAQELESAVETWKIENEVGKKEELKERYEKTMKSIEDRKKAAELKKLKAALRSSEHGFGQNWADKNGKNKQGEKTDVQEG